MNALEVSPFHGIALYKSTFTYLLTYVDTRSSDWAFNFKRHVCEQCCCCCCEHGSLFSSSTLASYSK